MNSFIHRGRRGYPLKIVTALGDERTRDQARFAGQEPRPRCVFVVPAQPTCPAQIERVCCPFPMVHIQARWRHAGPWLAIATAPAALMLGGSVAQQTNASATLPALALGAGVLFVLAGLQGRLGVRERKPLVALARPVLGAGVARWTNTVLISVLMLGWAGFGVAVAGRSLATLLSVPEIVAFVGWAAVLVAGLWRGIHRGSLIALLSSLATAVLIGWGFFQAQALGQPPASVQASGTLFGGVSLVVGYGAAFSLRCADFSMNVQRTRHVFYTALFGLGLPLFVVSVAGAWLYRVTGTWDLSLLLTQLGFPALAQLFVAVGFLGAGLSNMHSGRLALQDLLRCRGKVALLIVGLASVVLAWLGFDRAMVLWLHFLSVVVIPLIGVMLVHYGFGFKDGPRGGALAAWGCGALVGLLTPEAWPQALTGIVTAALVYVFVNAGCAFYARGGER